MKRALLAGTTLALTACASVPPESAPTNAPPTVSVPDIGGDYSNYGQAFQAETPEAAWDLRVVALAGHQTDSFLVRRTQRSGGESQTRLYRFSPARNGGLELRIALLEEAQEALAPDALLDWADGEFDPGCVLSLHRENDGWAGATDPASCRVQDPIYGEIGIRHELGFYPDRIVIRLSVPELENAMEPPVAQRFDRVHGYRLQGGIQRYDAANVPTVWVISQESTVYSDGRMVRLSEADGTPMEMSLQMTYLPWQPNEPDYLRLDVYHAGSGAMMGYYWAQTDATTIDFNGGWMTVKGERVQPGE